MNTQIWLRVVWQNVLVSLLNQPTPVDKFDSSS